MEDDLIWGMTSKGGGPKMEDDLHWKTTSSGR